MFVALAVSGCQKKMPLLSSCNCGNKTIKLDHSKPKGVDHKAIYLCPNDTITWVPGPHVRSFTIVFVGQDLPFGATATFAGTTLPVTSPPLPDPGELTVFKYDLTIVDDSGTSHPFDPHVIGGGGL
jgi:hypothetical protein